MKVMSLAQTFAASTLAALMAISGVVRADTRMFPSLAPPVSGWEGEATVTCRSGCDSCACGTSNSALNATANNYEWLQVRDFRVWDAVTECLPVGVFSLPAGQAISRIAINVQAKYPDGTPGRVETRVIIPGVGNVNFTSPQFTSAGGLCEYRFDAGTNELALAPFRANPNLINQIGIDVRRATSTNAPNLRVSAVRVVIETLPDCDGDGVPDAETNDDDGDNVQDSQDCAPCNSAAWRNTAYLDQDGDGRGSGGLVASPCYGAVAPPGYSLLTGDNCPTTHNPLQENCDGDSLGDACDDNDDNDQANDSSDCARCDPSRWRNVTAYVDSDGDGWGAGVPVGLCIGATLPAPYVYQGGDNCPASFNPNQSDFNGDGVGDACQDTDGDGTLDSTDNCQTQYNPSQADQDGDGLGNVCDTCPTVAYWDDYDNDCIGSGSDNCPDVSNLNQADRDGDGQGDACDPCPDSPSAHPMDSDSDGVDDACDNCPFWTDPSQADSDGDGYGNPCDFCPNLASVHDGPPINLPIDRDGDMVFDACDQCPSVSTGSTLADCPSGIGRFIATTDYTETFAAGGSWQVTFQGAQFNNTLEGQPVFANQPWSAVASGNGQTGGGILNVPSPGAENYSQNMYVSVGWNLTPGQLRAVANTIARATAEQVPTSGSASVAMTMEFRVDSQVCYMVRQSSSWQPALTVMQGSALDGRRIGPGIYRMTLTNSAQRDFTTPGEFTSSADWTMYFFACDAPDADADGIPNDLDNCPTVANALQLDTTGCRVPDGIGDACQCPGDADRNGAISFTDITSVLSSFGSVYCASISQPACPAPGLCLGDADANGTVNFSDVTAVLVNFGSRCQ